MVLSESERAFDDIRFDREDGINGFLRGDMGGYILGESKMKLW